jgi:hypothetical protein
LSSGIGSGENDLECWTGKLSFGRHWSNVTFEVWI